MVTSPLRIGPKTLAWTFKDCPRRRLFLILISMETWDCYLLNHFRASTRSMGNISDRLKPDSLAGDRLYRNELIRNGIRSNNHFLPRLPKRRGYSIAAWVMAWASRGRFECRWISWYICINDFHENDYLYINRKNGTFRQDLEKSMGHSSRFSWQRCWRYQQRWPSRHHHTDMMPSNEDVIRPPPGMIPMRSISINFPMAFIIRQPATAFNWTGWFLIRLFFSAISLFRPGSRHRLEWSPCLPTLITMETKTCSSPTASCADPMTWIISISFQMNPCNRTCRLWAEGFGNSW